MEQHFEIAKIVLLGLIWFKLMHIHGDFINFKNNTFTFLEQIRSKM